MSALRARGCDVVDEAGTHVHVDLLAEAVPRRGTGIWPASSRRSGRARLVPVPPGISVQVHDRRRDCTARYREGVALAEAGELCSGRCRAAFRAQ